MKRGDQVMSRQTVGPRFGVHMTEGSTYTVNSVSGDGRYILILGDDNRGHHFNVDLFTNLSGS